MIKNILITGSGGFIGKNLKEFFQKKYFLFCPRSFELDLMNSRRVSDFFQQNNIDFVIHCANKGGSRGEQDDVSIVDDNLRMFQNLQNCLSGKKMIFFGSGAQYDRFRSLTKVKESELGDFIPKDFYGYSKFVIAKAVQDLENVLCLNIFGAYGKYEKDSRFPTYAIIQNLKNEPIIINKNVVFDYLFIEDLCSIIAHFIEQFPKEKLINLTPTESISLLDIANIVNSIGDFKSKVIINDKGINFEYTGNNSVLLKELPHFNFTDYQTGLTFLYNYLQLSFTSM